MVRYIATACSSAISNASEPGITLPVPSRTRKHGTAPCAAGSDARSSSVKGTRWSPG